MALEVDCLQIPTKRKKTDRQKEISHLWKSLKGFHIKKRKKDWSNVTGLTKDKRTSGKGSGKEERVPVSCISQAETQQPGSAASEQVAPRGVGAPPRWVQEGLPPASGEPYDLD
jgi:hypothetical protein